MFNAIGDCVSHETCLRTGENGSAGSEVQLPSGGEGRVRRRIGWQWAGSGGIRRDWPESGGNLRRRAGSRARGRRRGAQEQMAAAAPEGRRPRKFEWQQRWCGRGRSDRDRAEERSGGGRLPCARRPTARDATGSQDSATSGPDEVVESAADSTSLWSAGFRCRQAGEADLRIATTIREADPEKTRPNRVAIERQQPTGRLGQLAFQIVDESVQRAPRRWFIEEQVHFRTCDWEVN